MKDFLEEKIILKYNKKYNNQGKITYQVYEFIDGIDQEIKNFQTCVENAQKKLKTDERLVLFCIQPHFDNFENLSHCTNLVITKDFCYVINTADHDPQPQRKLNNVKISPVLGLLYDKEKQMSCSIQSFKSSSCGVFSAKISKHLAYLSDEMLKNATENIENHPNIQYFKNSDTCLLNQVSFPKAEYNCFFNLKKLPCSFILNILKYSQSQRFNETFFKLHGFSQKEIETLNLHYFFSTKLNMPEPPDNPFKNMKEYQTLSHYLSKYQELNANGKCVNSKIANEKKKYQALK